MAMWIQLNVVDGLIGLHYAEVRHLYLFCQTKRAYTQLISKVCDMVLMSVGV